MTDRRGTALAAVIVLVVIAMLGFLYGAPAGRHARHESVRVFRLVGNATGIYVPPALRVRTWSPSRGPLLVELYESGRVVVSGRGDPFERRLPPKLVGEILENGRAAFGDFSSEGCGTKPGGVSSELYLLIDGRWFGNACRDAAEWPRGSATKQLLELLSSKIAGMSGRF